MRYIEHDVDLCVVGGGIAGLCTAVSAARHGIKVILMQDRPVLGGNSSSEIRMWVCGAHGDDNRETGIIEEVMLENYYRNLNLSFSIWDSVLYEKAKYQDNLTLLLNCTCLDAIMDNNKIIAVKGWQLTNETHHTVKAKYFADCSGDSILAPLTGAKYMLGREAKSEFNETIPPDVADKKTMGMSCLFQIRETDSPKKFISPSWAYTYEDDSEFPCKVQTVGDNFWWIELGGEADSIHDTEELKDELLKISFGVWDHMKNHGDHGVENWELEWMGFLPGKRESRRYVGKYTVTENDVRCEGRFEDVIAYGGWSMDDHFPAGFHHKGECSTIFHPAPSPWGIPLRCLYSENIENLLFAGRNISVTHAALSSSRVMATCGVIGQALGTAVAQAILSNKTFDELDIDFLQQTLMLDDCFIPFKKRKLSKLTAIAKTNAPLAVNGIERGELNCHKGGAEFTFDEPQSISKIRLIFDSDLNRDYHNMPNNYPLKQEKYKLPETLVKSYKILADGKEVITETNNYQRLVLHNIDVVAKKIEFIPLETWGDKEYRVFAIDLI